MSGRFAIIGLTALAFLALGAGTCFVPSTATAEFRAPGLFGGKPAVKRKRYRARKPIQPIRNPDRVSAAVSAKAVSPDVAKNSNAVLGVGTTSAASIALALPAPKRTAEAAKDEVKDEATAPTEVAEANPKEIKSEETKPQETKSAETQTQDNKTAETDTAETEIAETETADSETDDSKSTDSKTSESKTADAEDDAPSADEVASDGDAGKTQSEPDTELASKADPKESETDSKSESKAETETASASKTANSKAANSKTAGSEADAETEGDSKAAAADSKPSDTASAADEADKTAEAQDSAPDADSTADSKVDDAKAADAKASGSETAEDVKTADAGADKDADGADKDATTEISDTGEASAADDKTAEEETAEKKAGVEETAETKTTETKTAGNASSDAAGTASDGAAQKSEGSDAAEGALAEKADEATEVAETAAKAAETATSEVETAAAATAAAATAATAAALAAKAEADSAEEATEKAEAESAKADDGASPVPPAPEPKPEAVHLANKTGSAANNEADANADTSTKTASDTSSEPDADPELTVSISSAAAPSDSAQSVEAPDVTDVARAADAPADAAPEPDPRAYDATVVLDVSPPPGNEKPETEDTKIAALSPGSALASDDGSAAEGEALVDEAVDIGPPPPPPIDPVIAAVRSKLEGPAAPKVATADLEALKALYGERDDNPLWVTGDGLTSKAKVLIATIHDADDWGLDAGAYAVPAAGTTLTTDEAQADAELALSAAALKYARHAQTGRLTPARAHKLFDYRPKAREPMAVLTEIAASETPDKALLALHPQTEQYQRLHTALVHARDTAKSLGGNPDNDRNVQIIVINMERWRWLPSKLGNFHVWNNIPEFQFRVYKGGREVYQEKSIVGQVKYATPFFSAPMRNIVFNPNWTVPPTIVKEDIAPKLKGPRRSGGLFSGPESRNRMLRRYGLTVSKKGKPVDADAVDWQNANVHAYTFTQDPGPHNVLGRFKFNFPNSHAIYMHDTTQKELFSQRTRTLSHGCIRVNQPARFAALLLGEDKGWTMATVQDVLARAQGQTKVIALKRKVPVHLTYNTAVADGYGSIQEYGDVYGIDSRMAAKLFKNPAHFDAPYSADFAETRPTRRYSGTRPRHRRSANGVDNLFPGILGN